MSCEDSLEVEPGELSLPKARKRSLLRTATLYKVQSIIREGFSNNSGDSFLIEHTDAVVDGMDALLASPDFSDVTFVVEGERIHAHRAVLAARCEYFRDMLYGGLKESSGAEVKLEGTNAFAFRTLLRYIYTGKVELSAFKIEELLATLQLAHEYRLVEIQRPIVDFLKVNASSLIQGVLAEELSSATTLCAERLAEVTRLQGVVKSLEDKVQSLESRNSELSRKLAEEEERSKKSMKEKDDAIRELQQSLVQETAMRSKIEKDVRVKSDEIATLQRRIEQLNASSVENAALLAKVRSELSAKDAEAAQEEKMVDRKAVINKSRMSEDMQRDAIDCATQAFEKHNNERDIARYVREEFDKKYNPAWHCVVGKDYMFCVMPDSQHYIYFHLGQLVIVLFKSV